MDYLIPLLALVFMEIVLGIDNIVFIAILCQKLPEKIQRKAQTTGIMAALVLRIGLLFAISWVMKLTAPLVSILQFDLSGRDLILLGGGGFLIMKATHEIYIKMEEEPKAESLRKSSVTFGQVIFQIILLDLVFSLDSVITAVGMVKELWMMVVAVVISMGVMLAFASKVSYFIAKHPSLKILSLSFLILIGVLLFAEGMHQHINRGYIYFAMFFSLVVEFVNIQVRSKRHPSRSS